MTYLDGSVAAVPTRNKSLYLQHAKLVGEVFREYGALKVMECWGDDIPEGKITSLSLAVQCREDETVVFSWILWPSKAVRDAAMAKAMTDPRVQPDTNPMPFDGQRMIFGGFDVISEI